MDILDKSLDELISTKRANNKPNAQKKFSGKVKTQQTRQLRKDEPYKIVKPTPSQNFISNPTPSFKVTTSQTVQPEPSTAGLSIFERVGTNSQANRRVSGTYVLISNLNDNITLLDINELCAAIGE
jgi:hypothetical protein